PAGRSPSPPELPATPPAGGAALTIDGDALAAYSVYGSVPEPHTIVREIAMLPPGHVLAVDARGGPAGPRPVLSPEALVEAGAPAPSRTEAIETTSAVLADAVRAHLVSDVPLGVL